MSMLKLLDDASSVMTVVSFATFMGIIIWTYLLHTRSDFDEAARLPFDEEVGGN